jgi:PAS domain S-box-containing protein
MKDDKKTKKQLILELEHPRRASKKSGMQKEGEREAFYRLATEHSDEAIIIISRDKRLFFNQRYLELAGCKTPAELEQKPFLDGVHPDDQVLIKQMIRQREAGKATPARYECRLLSPDGFIIPHYIYGTTGIACLYKRHIRSQAGRGQNQQGTARMGKYF